MATAEHKSTRGIWIVFTILLVVTVSEVFLALWWPGSWPALVLNFIFIIMTFTKAFYIISEFMHLKYEVKNLIVSLIVPMTLFIWFIIAFLADGNSWLIYRLSVN
ncbi:MAG: cytochrome C oxidase subunit IV family protein [Bacteroidetes bacterium]|nr:cytochrome C oxidase subunit IV family protein [Bacteroidota bacterium]